MAIKTIFNNNTLYKPNTHSFLKTKKDGSAAVTSADSLFIIGEASAGEPGSSEGVLEFQASQVADIVSKYQSGPIVDCVIASRVPSKTQGVGGPGKYFIYKTNASVQASHTFDNAAVEDLLVIKDIYWGTGGNNVSVIIEAGSTARQKKFTIKKINETSEVLGENAATAQIQIQYTGDASTAALAIAGAAETSKTLTTTLAGDQTDGSANLNITLSGYNLKELADFINGQTGYSASLLDSPAGIGRLGYELDSVTESDIKSAAVSLYRLQKEIVALINDNSNFVVASLASTPVEDVPAAVSETFLTGGARGASSNSNFSTGLAKSISKNIAQMVVAVSQDATSDIALGLTDPASAYTIASLCTALDSHLRERGKIKNRREAQGFIGFRKSTKADVYSQCQTTGSELVQVAFQDVKVIDVDANLTWKQPHVMAALFAGIRLGTSIGEPLTKKFINAVDVGHFVDATTGRASGDFDPLVDYENAIIAGATFVEPDDGIGFKIVVDNTTYGVDNSFIWNRGSVIEAAFYTSKDIRNLVDLLFIGNKVAGDAEASTAESLKNQIGARLKELKEDLILSPSDDAPNGYVEGTFSVVVSNNVATVAVEIKPVNGLDFVLITFTVGETNQTA